MRHTRPTWLNLTAALVACAAVTFLLSVPLGVTNGTTVALAYLLLVLFVASAASLAVAIVTSIASLLALNYFFLPPVGTFTIADPHNWIALGAFLVVSMVASHLSTTARNRTHEALASRNDLARLFDVSRDVLLTTDVDAGLAVIARHVARRFELDIVTICQPSASGGWQLTPGGPEDPAIDAGLLERVWATASGTLEFDATSRSYGGQHTVTTPTLLRLVPIRLGTRPIGILALGRNPLEPGTADAIAGVVAIATERATFLGERRVAELARQRADLSSALLAALGHDLRTPLTAIKVAVGNLQEAALDPHQKTDQLRLALDQIDHLGRLLQEILDMARIEARAVHPERQWVTPADVVDAALALTGAALDEHQLRIDADADRAVEIDPRLTSAALAHVLENAARYSPSGSTVAIECHAAEQGLEVSVTDDGPGLEAEDLERLFEPFVRGATAAQRVVQGTGLGLAITRGLLAAEQGRIWAENAPGHGARFAITVPAAVRATAVTTES